MYARENLRRSSIPSQETHIITVTQSLISGLYSYIYVRLRKWLIIKSFYELCSMLLRATYKSATPVVDMSHITILFQEIPWYYIYQTRPHPPTLGNTLPHSGTPSHTREYPPTLSLAATPYFVFARGGGRNVGSSRMCKSHSSLQPIKSLLHHFSAVKGVYAPVWNTWNHTDIVYAILTVTNKRPFGRSLRGVEFTHSARPYFSSASTHEDKVGSSS